MEERNGARYCQQMSHRVRSSGTIETHGLELSDSAAKCQLCSCSPFDRPASPHLGVGRELVAAASGRDVQVSSDLVLS